MLLSDERVNVHKNGSKWHEKKRMKVYVCMGMCVCVRMCVGKHGESNRQNGIIRRERERQLSRNQRGKKIFFYFFNEILETRKR